jgi:hypothetical protein
MPTSCDWYVSFVNPAQSSVSTRPLNYLRHKPATKCSGLIAYSYVKSLSTFTLDGRSAARYDRLAPQRTASPLPLRTRWAEDWVGCSCHGKNLFSSRKLKQQPRHKTAWDVWQISVHVWLQNCGSTNRNLPLNYPDLIPAFYTQYKRNLWS